MWELIDTDLLGLFWPTGACSEVETFCSALSAHMGTPYGQTDRWTDRQTDITVILYLFIGEMNTPPSG